MTAKFKPYIKAVLALLLPVAYKMIYMAPIHNNQNFVFDLWTLRNEEHHPLGMKSLLLALIGSLIAINLNAQCDSSRMQEFYRLKSDYERASVQTNIGKGFVIAGTLSLALDLAYLQLANSDDEKTEWIAALIFLNGSILTAIGIPVLISGKTKSKNCLKRMKAICPSAKYKIGPAKNGVGLTVNF